MKRVYHSHIYKTMLFYTVFMLLFNSFRSYLFHKESLKEVLIINLTFLVISIILYIYGKKHPRIIIENDKIIINRFLRKPIVFKYDELNSIHRSIFDSVVFTTDEKKYELEYGFIENKYRKEFENTIDELKEKLFSVCL